MENYKYKFHKVKEIAEREGYDAYATGWKNARNEIEEWVDYQRAVGKLEWWERSTLQNEKSLRVDVDRIYRKIARILRGKQ